MSGITSPIVEVPTEILGRFKTLSTKIHHGPDADDDRFYEDSEKWFMQTGQQSLVDVELEEVLNICRAYALPTVVYQHAKWGPFIAVYLHPEQALTSVPKIVFGFEGHDQVSKKMTEKVKDWLCDQGNLALVRYYKLGNKPSDEALSEIGQHTSL